MVIRRAETVIMKPADEVWSRIRDFGDISWVPNTETCVRDGDDRHIGRAAWDFVLVQRLEEHDDTRRTFSYILPEAPLSLEIIGGPGYIAPYLNGTITVTPTGESESFVTWDIDAAPYMVESVRGEYQGALNSLKAELEH